jgi:hypothetical protein
VIQSEALHTLLAPLVAGRVFPVVFPQEPLPTWPAIRYTPVGGSTNPDVCGSGDGTLDDVQVQIDVVASTYLAARDLHNQVRAALMGWTAGPPAVADGAPIFDYDAETRTHRAIQTFTLYPSSSTLPPP